MSTFAVFMIERLLSERSGRTWHRPRSVGWPKLSESFLCSIIWYATYTSHSRERWQMFPTTEIAVRGPGLPSDGNPKGVLERRSSKKPVENSLNGLELVGARQLLTTACRSQISLALSARRLIPHSDAHSDFTALKTVNRLVSINTSMSKLIENSTNNWRENARPHTRS